MPTTQPRYTITDTGSVRELLNDAQRRWPDVTDRKQLLLRLAQAGHMSLRIGEEQADAARRRERQQAALRRLPGLIDTEELLTDSAWR